jgi:hypothetical protein
MKRFIERIRSALGPKVPILILSPPARGFKKGVAIFPWRYIDRIAREKREAASRAGVAFWPYLKAMGGSRSVGIVAGLYWKDLIHVKPGYHKIAMTKLHQALLWELYRYVLKTHPTCKRKDKNP